MASLNMFFAPAVVTATATASATRGRRVQTYATASKSSGGGSEEKGFFEWLVGALEKDQLVETDPILKKVEEKSGGTVGKRSSSVPAPKKSTEGGGFGGFGGLFAKK